ncbi:MAG: protein phosphatase 2C domain-containing protein [Anaerolineae bacterium]|nr:protein phosphatase 2C domain-containing protein [Anaerolineae bacterium]
MDFFRRIFNNPDDPSQASKEEATGVMTNKVVSATKPEPAIDPSEKVTDELENTPKSENDVDDLATGEFRAEDTEIPDTLPERSMFPLDAAQAESLAPSQSANPMGVTRPLPQEPVLEAQSGHLIFGQKSDVGMVRSNNQDSAMSIYFTSDTVDEKPDFGIFIVADGMGGHSEGEKASAITARTIMEDILKAVYMPLLQGAEMDADRPTVTEALNDAIKHANEEVRMQVQDGGTTITAVVVLGDQAYLGHVGDSRAYLISASNEVEQLTRDHSVVQRLIELGQLTPEEAETHDQRNVLYRAIGQSEEVDIDILRRRLPLNSYILLCSDGLWGMMTKDDIRDIVSDSLSPQEACDKLISLANTNGGTDNVTAVLLKMPGN